jgi:uncharacterized membrane protein YedE/YeeE
VKSFGSLASGVLFGIGLWVSGMTLPSKVLGFLDFTGRWDPSLALVMGAAVASCGTFAWALRRRSSPILDPDYAHAERTHVDGRLITGAALFGVGWGLLGVCPGPAIVSLASGEAWPMVFVLAMAAGAWIEGLGTVVQRSTTSLPKASNT